MRNQKTETVELSTGERCVVRALRPSELLRLRQHDEVDAMMQTVAICTVDPPLTTDPALAENGRAYVDDILPADFLKLAAAINRMSGLGGADPLAGTRSSESASTPSGEHSDSAPPPPSQS